MSSTPSDFYSKSMSSLDSIPVPAGAELIDPPQDAPEMVTSVPIPSPPPSPSRKRQPSLVANSLVNPTMSFIPQLFMSASIPTSLPDSPSVPIPVNPKPNAENSIPTLLSSKVPLSLPVTSTNFKRFISIVGPVFWLQDRIEEIWFWKRGWIRTSVWMAAYILLCFFPRLVLLLPHLIFIGVILSTYPYPASSSSDPLLSQPFEASQPIAEGSVPWQANIQGIQNLMGAVADVHDVVEPYVHHLYLTPSHLSSRPNQRPTRRSPYTPHIVTLLVLSFFPLLFVIHLPLFPIRQVFLLVGLSPFIVLHPYSRMTLPVLLKNAVIRSPKWIARLQETKTTVFSVLRGRDVKPENEKGENADEDVSQRPLSMIIQRLIDDDRMDDQSWNSELREVELWENERFGGPLPPDSPTMISATLLSSSSPPLQKGWSKQNLRPGERGPWARAQDGWNGGGSGGSVKSSGVEGSGEVNSNLTFSLAPGWTFVETEDWRKDIECNWSGCRCDQDGWVYTNDYWLGARPAPYTSGGGSLTRRRRWTRRVWYDPKKAAAET